MEEKIKFGTDGWRGVIAREFTFGNVRRCAQGVANYIRDLGWEERGLVVAYDTRFASDEFAKAAAEVLAANSIKVFLCAHPTPTPVASYIIKAKSAGGGIIITASHNPPMWNGFKYKPEDATSAPPEITDEIEKRIPPSEEVKHMPLEEAKRRGIVECFDFAPVYFEHLRKLVDIEALKEAGFRVIFDPMYGAAAGYLPKILSGGRTEVFEIHGERNPLFPGLLQPEPIARNLGELAQVVREKKADVGIATDGDADRVGIVDEKGEFIPTPHTFALLALYMLEIRGERGALVKTLTSGSMPEKLGEIYGVPVFETPVGFKYVGPIMLRENALIGGEESGGYGIRGHIPERDGILCGLLFLDLMRRTGKRASELISLLFSKVGPHYYDRIDLHMTPERRKELEGKIRRLELQELCGLKVRSADDLDGRRFKFEDGSWLLLRFSGTEPLLRIYAEASSPSLVAKLLEAGRELVEGL